MSNDNVIKTEIAPFGLVWKEHMLDPAIPYRVKALMAVLATYARAGEGEVFPAQETLANILGVKQQTVSRWISEAVGHGLLDRKYRSRVDPTWKGNPAARIYTLKKPKQRQISTRRISDMRPMDTNNTNGSIPYISKSKNEKKRQGKRMTLTNNDKNVSTGGEVVETSPEKPLVENRLENPSYMGAKSAPRKSKQGDPVGSLPKWAENDRKRKQVEMLNSI